MTVTNPVPTWTTTTTAPIAPPATSLPPVLLPSSITTSNTSHQHHHLVPTKPHHHTNQYNNNDPTPQPLQPPGIHCHVESTIRTIPNEEIAATLVLPPVVHPHNTTNEILHSSEVITVSEPKIVEHQLLPKNSQDEKDVYSAKDPNVVFNGKHRSDGGKKMESREVDQWTRKLLKAARTGDYDAVVELLTLPEVRDNPHLYDIQCRCVNGYSPLQWATLRGHDVIVEYILRQHHYPIHSRNEMIRDLLCAKSSFGSNVLHLACSKGDLKLTQLFVEMAVETTSTTTTTTNQYIESQNEAGWTSLHYACNFGCFPILQYLTHHSAPETFYIVDEDGETLLHRCCYHTGRLPIVQFIIKCDDKNYHNTTDRNDQLIHRLSYKGETAYDIAIKYKQDDVADYLLSVMTTIPTESGVVTDQQNDNKKSDHRGPNYHTLPKSAKVEIMPMDCSITMLAPNRIQQYHSDGDDNAVFQSAVQQTTLSFGQSVTLAMPFGTTTNDETAVTSIPTDTATRTLSDEEVQQWNELFMSVVESGDLDTVKLCIVTECIDLEQNKVVDNHDGNEIDDACTALHLACMYNHFDIVQYLIEEAGMNVTTKTSHHGSTVLHIATRNDAIHVLQYLIDNFLIDVEVIDHDGKTALHCASRLGLLDIVTYLIEYGRANYVTKDKNGYTALQLASRYGRLNVAQFIMERYMVDAKSIPASTRDSDLHTAFWLACRYGQFPIVQFFIEKGGINVNIKHDGDGMTALLFACQYGALLYVKFLCEDCNADIDVLDKLGDSPLDKAKTYGHREVAIYMSEQYTQLSQAAEKLRNAAKFGNLNAVMDCICNNPLVNINAGGSTGKTALHYSIANGHCSIVKYLVEQCQANVNSCNVDGATPLHYACRYGHLKCVEFLCDYDCPDSVDVHILDNQNETALDKAKKYGHTAIVEFLQHYATENTSNNGNTTSNSSDAVQLSSQLNQERKQRAMKCFNEAEPIIVTAEMISTLDIETCFNGKATLLDPIQEYPSLPMSESMVERTESSNAATNGIIVENDDAASSYNDNSGGLERDDKMNMNTDHKSDPDVIVEESTDDVILDDVDEVNKNVTNEFTVEVNSDDEETRNKQNECAEMGENVLLDNFETQPKVSEAMLLQMMDKLQKENQKLMNLFEKNSAVPLNISRQGTGNKLSWLTDERQELLDEMLGKKFSDQRDEHERQAILANSMHREFYLLLTRKLYCMINSCENLSTGMVTSGNKEIIRTHKSTTSMLHDSSQQIRGAAIAGIGLVVSTAFTVVKESVPGIKIVAEPIHAMFNVIVSLKSKRDQYMAVARVADFASVASILQAGNSKALQSTVEKFARLLIRARSSLSSFPFTEKQDKFGRMKQYMINFLADSDNTPIKEQASFAADCAVAHIMMPSEESILYGILNGDVLDTNLSEALAAATLNISLDQIRNLDPISIESSDMLRSTADNIGNLNITNPPNNMTTFVVQPSSDDEDDNDLDLDVSSDGTLEDGLYNSDRRRASSSMSVDVVQLEDKVADLERKIEGLGKAQNTFHSNLKKEDANSAGDGLLYADFREQYKDDVNTLKRQSVDCDERISFHASEIALLKEQVQLLQKQLSESTVASSSQQVPLPAERANSEKVADRKRWIPRRRDPKDP